MTIAIGELSRLTGVKVPTIRYYEDAGLMPAPLRSGSNRRVYDEASVRRLRFVRHARDLGFEVEAIRELLVLTAQPAASCDGADSIARRHVEAIDAKLAKLVALRVEVVRMIDECAHGQVAKCRVIEVLADHDECLNVSH